MCLKFIQMTERKQHSLPSKDTGSGKEVHLDFAISAYHVFEIHPDDREKTAFSTKQEHLQCKRVPFGLCNAGLLSVHQIASLLAGMTWEERLAFFNDVLVFSPTFAKHCEFLHHTLALIEEAGLKVKTEKCCVLPVACYAYLISSRLLSWITDHWCGFRPLGNPSCRKLDGLSTYSCLT